MRTGAWTLTLVVVGIVGSASVNAALRHPAPPPAPRHGRRPAATPETPRPESVAVTVAVAAPVVQQGTPAAASLPAADSAVHISLVAPPTTTSGAVVDSTPAKPPAKRPMSSILPQGRTDLADSVYAVRSGDTVVVHFDTSPLRTRRADKFETVVRQTLHTVYGSVADSVLAAVPAGKLVAPNELVTTLPSRGIHLAAPSGARLALWPETRPGRDGPLVVSYRTTTER